ncbi:MAG: nuclear transport factor 2 family protein [Sandarakinorhabdus sp.]|nr:nuclear transport factor 2 family protein [Sandarakinorhabdus sp.]
MTSDNRLPLVDALMARYNARDVDGYAALMTEDATEGLYRGAVLRDGREGVCAGLAAMFAAYPENHAVVHARYAVGDKVVLHEEVFRSNAAEPFEVVSIYSFAGDRVERVDFVR